MAFLSRTMVDANVASAKIHALTTNAQSTANARLMSRTKEEKQFSCRSAVSSRSPVNVRDWNSNCHRVKLSAMTMPIVAATTNAAQQAALTCVMHRLTRGPELQLKRLVTDLMSRHRHWKTFPKRICDRSPRKAVLLLSDASQPAFHHRQSHGNAAELKYN